jgi:hypothetical protein
VTLRSAAIRATNTMLAIRPICPKKVLAAGVAHTAQNLLAARVAVAVRTPKPPAPSQTQIARDHQCGATKLDQDREACQEQA